MPTNDPYANALEFLLAHVARHGDGVASVQAENLRTALPHVVERTKQEAAEAKKVAEQEKADEAKAAAAESKASVTHPGAKF